MVQDGVGTRRPVEYGYNGGDNERNGCRYSEEKNMTRAYRRKGVERHDIHLHTLVLGLNGIVDNKIPTYVFRLA